MVASRTAAPTRVAADMKMVACLLAFTVILLSLCRVGTSRPLTSLSSHGADAQPEGGRTSRAVLQPPAAAADQPPQLGIGDDGAVQSLAVNSGLSKKKSHAKAPPKHHGHGHHAPPADLSPPAPDPYGGQPPEAPAPKHDAAPAPAWPFPWPQPGNQWLPFHPPPLPGNDWPPLPLHPPPVPAWPQPEPGKQWPPLPPFLAWPQPEPGKQWPPFPEWPQPEPGNNQWPPLPPFPEWPQPEPGKNQWPPLPPFPFHPPPMPSWQWPPAPSVHGKEERGTSSLPAPVPARK